MITLLKETSQTFCAKKKGMTAIKDLKVMQLTSRSNKDTILKDNDKRNKKLYQKGGKMMPTILFTSPENGRKREN